MIWRKTVIPFHYLLCCEVRLYVHYKKKDKWTNSLKLQNWTHRLLASDIWLHPFNYTNICNMDLSSTKLCLMFISYRLVTGLSTETTELNLCGLPQNSLWHSASVNQMFLH
jgi:hypothetical protein